MLGGKISFSPLEIRHPFAAPLSPPLVPMTASLLPLPSLHGIVSCIARMECVVDRQRILVVFVVLSRNGQQSVIAVTLPNNRSSMQEGFTGFVISFGCWRDAKLMSRPKETTTTTYRPQNDKHII
jgi:hypothetical protein